MSNTRFSNNTGQINMTHGAGGKSSAQLVEEVFVRHLDNPWLRQGNDQALFEVGKGHMVMSTDGHVVSPLFFPGGDIGSLSIHGTVNDVAMSGAKPLYIALSVILEEGFPIDQLDRIVQSIAQAAQEADVHVVTGDTKVVEKGSADGIFITTTGVGMVPDGIRLSAELVRPGDAILINGSIGDHGIAIMSSRENLEFETDIISDTASLHGLVARMIDQCPHIRCMRDPTRGGLSASLNEIARQADVGMEVNEAAIPIKPQVHAACELLGLDPVNIANEGKLVAFCPKEEADALLSVMRAHPLGREASIIGEVVADHKQMVTLGNAFGGSRIMDWLSGEQLPRIC